MRKFLLFSVFFALFLSSCGFFEPVIAVFWTDRPEFAIYAEYFNSSQNEYKIETFYFESPAQELAGAKVFPDIVAGSQLKSAAARPLFQPLDYLFKDGSLEKEAFYSYLLALGSSEDKQYLLPVSFNIPAIVFSRENGALVPNRYIISLEEIKETGKAYNIESKGVYTRMGFSPSWNDEFLFVAATLFNTEFREADPLAWDSRALENSVNYLRAWIGDANTSISMEEDFSFKYFFTPQPKLAISGRILFTYMESSEFFTLAEEQRNSLDFRWITGPAAGEKAAQDGESPIPTVENNTYLGLCKGGKAKKAASAFIRWFFQESTQRLLLEESKKFRMNETLFGIGNGFSGMRTVTEQIYPQFYPGLLGHMPPEESLTPPNILPRNWVAVKLRVILPYLHDRISTENPPNSAGRDPLERQLADWFRINRGM
jgi:ABC-type glycerol-3-phosphate transport system substrate-binding protein